jgi:cobalt-zinc-cadmium efflux system outer membrane protein
MRPVALDGQLEFDRKELTWESALGELLASSPELSAAQARIGRAGWGVQRARAEPIPNLDLEGSVQFDNESSDTVASVRIGVPLPLWNRNQGGILRAQGELAAAQSEVRQIELELTNRLAQAFERYSNARYQVELYTKQILPDARQSLDIVQKGYSAGEFSFLSLLLAQRTNVQTNLMYIESLRQLRAAEVAIDGLLLVSEAASEMK